MDTPHLISTFPDHVDYEMTCPVCHEKITIHVKKEIAEKEGIRFPFEYVDVHGTPAHGVTLYIDKNWAVRGIEIFKNINVSPSTSHTTRFIPIRKGKISPMAQQLGIVSKKEFQILTLIDGKRDLNEIAKNLNQDLDKVNRILQKLVDKNMVVFEQLK